MTDQTTLQLWCAYPDDLLDEASAKACQDMLSAEELERLRAFQFDQHRREYLAAHALARTALSRSSSIPPHAWRFKTNGFGKPIVDGPCALRFNLSHSPGLVVFLVGSGGEVGVDTEPFSRAESILEVAPRVLSPRELTQLEQLSALQRPLRCLRLWTLKESFVKALGVGMTLPLDKVSFVFDAERTIRLELDPVLKAGSQSWCYCLIEHAGHCIAVVTNSLLAPSLRLCEARLPSSFAELPLKDAAWSFRP